MYIENNDNQPNCDSYFSPAMLQGQKRFNPYSYTSTKQNRNKKIV